MNLLSDCEEKLNIKAGIELCQNALIEIAACVHWFNPFVYLLEKEVNRTCELSCDEAVVFILGDKTKREYGDMLISFVRADNQYKNSLASVTLTEGAEQLKERLGAIMELKKKSKSIKVITAIFTFSLCICFAVAGAYAAPSQPEEKKMQEQEQSEQRIEESEISVSDDENYKSIYMQNGYFYNSYIIEMSWNVYGDEYSDQTELLLKDGSVMKVYFSDTSKNYIADKEAIATTTELLSYLKDINTYPTIETPVITKIVYASDDVTRFAVMIPYMAKRNSLLKLKLRIPLRFMKWKYLTAV